MTLLYDKHGVRLYQGDADLEIKRIGDPIDMIFADPPYNNGTDYGFGAEQDRRDSRAYMEFTLAWLDAAFDALQDGGTLFLVIGCEWQAMVEDVADTAGFTLIQRLVWTYTFGQNQRRKYTPSHAAMLWLAKEDADPKFRPDRVLVPSWRAQNGDKRCADERGKTPGTVWEFPRLVGNAKERVGWHPTQLPYRLVERAVLAHSDPGDTVLDPFHGSGVTMRVCRDHERKYVGIDQNAEYLRRSIGESNDPEPPPKWAEPKGASHEDQTQAPR